MTGTPRLIGRIFISLTDRNTVEIDAGCPDADSIGTMQAVAGEAISNRKC